MEDYAPLASTATGRRSNGGGPAWVSQRHTRDAVRAHFLRTGNLLPVQMLDESSLGPIVAASGARWESTSLSQLRTRLAEMREYDPRRTEMLVFTQAGEEDQAQNAETNEVLRIASAVGLTELHPCPSPDGIAEPSDGVAGSRHRGLGVGGGGVGYGTIGLGSHGTIGSGAGSVVQEAVSSGLPCRYR